MKAGAVIARERPGESRASTPARRLAPGNPGRGEENRRAFLPEDKGDSRVSV